MSITINSQAGTYSAVYSPIKYHASSTNYDLGKRYKYIATIATDKIEVGSGDVVDWAGNPYWKLIFGTNHNFKKGDIVFLDDSANDNNYTGNWVVLNVPDSTSVILDMPSNQSYGANPTYLYKIIDYKMIPNPDGNLEIDFSRVLKDYISSNFQDTYRMYDAESTRYNYTIFLGEEYEFKYEFEDNYFSSGNAAFNNTSLSSGYLNTIPFKVGDRVKVQQELSEFTYNDNFFDGLFVGFWTSNASSAAYINAFEAGDQVYIDGQETNPQYNGWSEVFKIYDAAERAALSTVVGTTVQAAIVVNKEWALSTPPEPGSGFGYIHSEYNTVANITEIEYDAVFGIIVHTNIPWEGSTPAIPGEIWFADNRLTKYYKEIEVDGLVTFNSKFNRDDFTQDNNMSDYILGTAATGSNSNYFSTILNNDEYNRIQVDSKSWLLSHADLDDAVDGAYFNFYLNDGTNKKAYLSGSSNKKDYYIPVGLEQLLENSNNGYLSSTGGAFSTWYTDVATYSVQAVNNVILSSNSTIVSQPILFKINEDCSRFDEYSILFRDRMGSFISIPMIYKSTKITESSKNRYYHKEGSFDSNGDFSYNSWDRGDTTFYSKSRDKLVLTSGWVDEFENKTFKDMFTSPEIYIQFHNENDIIRPAIITNEDMQFRTEMEDQLFNYKVELQIAYDEIKF